MKDVAGINRFARVIQGRVHQINKNNGVTVDLGIINADYSLKTDSFEIAMPVSEFFVCEGQTIAPGDRVLVNWIGNDVVVVAKIKLGTEAQA